MGKRWDKFVSFFTIPTPPQRMSLDDYQGMVANYAGKGYLLAGSSRNGDTETIDHDFASYVNDAYRNNGIVFACSVARMMIFSQVRFMYQNLESGRPEDLEYLDALSLFETPWFNASTNDLLNRAIQDTDFAGNHYVVREGIGSRDKPYRLRRLQPDWVVIVLNRPPDEATRSDIVGYMYKPGNTEDKSKWEFFPIDGSNGLVAHWAPIPDPLAQYKGMSWVTPVVREINSDTAATKHKGKFFENGATPNIAVSMSDQVTPDEFAEFMEMMNDTKHGVDHAYETLYLGGGADVTVIGANLQQMDFKITQGAGETRIAAAARVHPVIVGLSEGMQGSSLNAGNFSAARRSFADGTMASLWSSVASAYSVLVPKVPKKRLWYDARDVPFLREDAKDVAEIQGREAETITKLTREGFVWDSVVLAVSKQDWSLLKHTGLYSVQLQKPGTTTDGKAVTQKGGNDATKTSK